MSNISRTLRKIRGKIGIGDRELKIFGAFPDTFVPLNREEVDALKRWLNLPGSYVEVDHRSAPRVTLVGYTTSGVCQGYDFGSAPSRISAIPMGKVSVVGAKIHLPIDKIRTFYPIRVVTDWRHSSDPIKRILDWMVKETGAAWGKLETRSMEAKTEIGTIFDNSAVVLLFGRRNTPTQKLQRKFEEIWDLAEDALRRKILERYR